jgi:type VI secretion system secreted protein VgrG
MPGSLKQANRRIQVTTVFGADVLVLQSLRAVDEISRPFELQLTLLSEQSDLNADLTLGKPMSVSIAPEEGSQRVFHGVVTEFTQLDWNRRFHEYRATVRPWFWLLTQSADCRVFQKKTIPAIFQEICQQAGFTDFRLALSGSYEPWEYCVQFRETDFNFLSRLLEQEGIFYFFEHTASKHVMVLSDDAAQLSTAPKCETVRFIAGGSGETPVEREHLERWSVRKALFTGTYATRAFNFKAPAPVLAGKSSITRPHGAGQYEVFDYPAPVAQESAAAVERVAKLRVQELQTPQMIASGAGNVVGLATGKLFTLAEHPRADFNKKYLVRAIDVEANNDSFQTQGQGGKGSQYSIAVTAVDAKEAFRPARITPKPLVHGSQTAIVVGPKGEEIHTDEFGRVKVQFHWDRLGKLDENSSCWIRVGQSWAGKNWGAIQLPRIGQEVIVSFLEGDPDRPLIIGSVYNGVQMPPYALPANKTQSGVKSRSTPNGVASNCNELRFEDKKGAELLYLQAEKDLEAQVKNNATESIGQNQTIDVGANRTLTVARNETVTIGGDLTITATGSITFVAGLASVRLDKSGAIVINGTTLSVAITGVVNLASTGGAVNIISTTGMIKGPKLIPI